MDYSHEKFWKHFEEIFNAKLPLKEAWNKVIDYPESVKPKDYWTPLRALNIEQEQLEVKAWMEQIVTADPIPKGTIALWVGITKLWDDENEKEFYAIYLQGSKKYDVKDTEWIEFPNYEPENNHGIIRNLNIMDEFLKTDKEDYAFLDWILPVAYCALMIDDINRTKLDKTLFLGSRKRLFVTTGFDEGDFVNLSDIIIDTPIKPIIEEI